MSFQVLLGGAFIRALLVGGGPWRRYHTDGRVTSSIGVMGPNLYGQLAPLR